MKKQSN